MSATVHEQPAPDFEIDRPDDYARYFLSHPREINFHLDLLVKRSALVTAYLDDGQEFFLTALVTVDAENGTISFDPPPADALNTAATTARQITLVANLDRVKVQFRVTGLRETQFDGRRTLTASIPNTLLRLQRREFFRLEPPLTTPIGCQIVIGDTDSRKTVEPKVADISGGGISLTLPTSLADACQPGTHFRDCRLDLPGEGVLLVNLRVRKAVEFSPSSGTHNLRVGCEFVDLPGTRLAMIERYITRIERERKARESGLAD